MVEPIGLDSRFAIVGAGIGGLSLALALAKAGAKNIQVFERRRDMQELGAGLQIGPNASRILGQLGIAKQLEAISERYPCGQMFDAASGRKLADLPMDDYAYSAYGAHSYQLLRNDLLQMLWAELKHVMGRDPVRMGYGLTGLSEASQGVTLNFPDQDDQSADMVVGADGVESKVRSYLLQEASAEYSGYYAWRGLLDLTSAKCSRSARQLDSLGVWMGGGKHLIAYPLKSGSLINLVGVSESQAWSHDSPVKDCPASEWLDDYRGWSEEPLSLISSLESCKKWSLRTMSPLATWNREAVCLLGDAAHPMLPSLAQGAGQAIEDAVVLAEFVGEQRYSVSELLQKYFASRIDRVTRVQDASLWNLKFFHRRESLMRETQNFGMRLGGSLTSKIIAQRYRWLYKASPKETYRN